MNRLARLSHRINTAGAGRARAASEGERRSAGWDIKSAGKNYLALACAQAASAVLTFAGAWMATRLLGKAGYGGLAAILTAQGVGQLMIGWTTVALVRYGCEEFVATGQLARTFWSRLLMVGLNLSIVLALSPWWLGPVAGWLRLPRGAEPWVLAYLAVSTMAVHVQYTLQAAKLPLWQGAVLVSEKALLVVGLALLGQSSLIPVVRIYVFAPVLPSIAALWRLRQLIGATPDVEGATLRRLFRFSWPLIPFSLAAFLTTNYLDAFFISYYLSAADLGVYALAYQVAGTLMQAPTLAGALLLPFFVTLGVEDSGDRVARYFGAVLPLICLTWSSACLLAAAAAGGLLLPYAFGAQFREATRLLWPLAAAAAVAGPAIMGYFPLSNARSATLVSTGAAVAAGLTNVGLNFVLTPRYGLMGNAWATVGAYVVSAVFAAAAMSRLEPASRSWALQATLPAVFAAAVASGFESVGAGGALLGAGAIGLLIAVFRRASLAAGARGVALLLHKRAAGMDHVRA